MTSPSTPPAGAPAADLTGRLLAGRYRLNRPIASGGMAQVWEATDETLARRVAVKILHPHLAGDAAFVQRFRGEAIAAARLAHPSIVSVYDTLADQGLNAIVMELVTGTTMRADLDQHGPLTLSAVLAIGTQVADALGAAHASGLVHRDVKPANILLSADGRVLVADFGIAKAAEGADLTSDGSMIGTAKYLAPEQVEGGPVDGRSDLYALGVVLYEALTGTPPFQADTDAATALARLHRDPVPPRRLRADIPEAVEAVVLRALARRPADRFPNAAAMRSALLAAGADPAKAPAAAQAAAAGATPGPSFGASLTSPVPPLPAAPAPRRRWALLVGVTTALVLVVGAVALVRNSLEGPAGHPLAIGSVQSFDPNGDRSEVDGRLPNLTDGDAATTWRTERYKNVDVAAYKGGVGVVASLDQAHGLTSVELTTPEGGWAAQVHLIDGGIPADLAGWGDPVATIDQARTGTNAVDLGRRRATAVLVWFTRVAPSHVTELSSIVVRGT